MKKLKLKKQVKSSLFIFVIIVLLCIIGIKKYNEYKYHQTNEYKLIQIGYSIDESKYLEKKLNKKNVERILKEQNKNEELLKFIDEKYFLEKNLDEYLDYKKDNKKKEYKDIVAIVNVHANRDWYEEPVKTDLSKGNAILVNKFHSLTKDFKVNDLTQIDLNYAYSENFVSKETNEAFKKMAIAAKNDGFQILANSSFRTYEKQEEIYKDFYYSKGISFADSYAARAGNSEHQTGLAIDLFTPGFTTTDTFENSDTYKWLISNCYKYGFILRYPKGKEYLTGYNYESWHFRYLGKDLATKVFDSKLTYDEYYAFYLEN